jgi:hypothetical protein
VRDDSIRHLLARSGELARAGAALCRINNPTALSLLERVVLEDLIRILWVTISDSNANKLQSGAVAALFRLVSVHVQSGREKIRSQKTGEDLSSRFLADKKNLPKPKSIETLAREAGVLDLYDIFYRSLSLDTHGHDLGPEEETGEWDLTVMHMQTFCAMTTAIGHAGTLWLRARQRVDNEVLRGFLGVKQRMRMTER